MPTGKHWSCFRDNQSIGATWAKIGEAHLTMSEHTEAEKALLNAADIFSRLGHLRGVGGVLINLGTVAAQLGDNKKARRVYIDAKNIAQQIDDRQLEFVAQMNLEQLPD